MGTTANFMKLRSSGTPKLGEWNINFEQALELAKKNGKFIVACWSNGDCCGYCVEAEQCMLEKIFLDWQQTQDAYFVFQCGTDKDKGKTVKDWIFNKETGLRYYPGYRISLYASKGNMDFDQAFWGNKLRDNKRKAEGAKVMIANLEQCFANASEGQSPEPVPEPTPVKEDFKVRLNETLTVKKVNAILDAIDKNNGYCPCQPKSKDSKCHCKDFLEEKKIGEPCICKIYVKQKKA